MDGITAAFSNAQIWALMAGLFVILVIGLIFIGIQLKGIRMDMNMRFEKVDARFEQMGAQMDMRFEKVDAHFEKVDARFEKVDARFEQIDQQFISIRTVFKALVSILTEKNVITKSDQMILDTGLTLNEKKAAA
jgi:uncharacterized membrane-anchored protein YhcB (DUF1043 family)